jgi:hypothetical protein
MSNAFCIQVAEARKATWAGLEYGQECWWGSDPVAISNGGVPGQLGEGNCTMSCTGMRGELCGDNWKMNLWVRNAGVP